MSSYIGNVSNIFLEYEKLWAKASQIPGYITKYEGLTLYMLSAAYSAMGNIIELGPFCGRSSVIIGQGMLSTISDNKLICIDDFSKQKSQTFPSMNNPKEELLKNIKYFNLEKIFTLYDMDSSAALNLFNKQTAGMIFIDSKHTEKQIRKEFPAALNIINSNGVILLHDYKNLHVEKKYSKWITENIVMQYETVYIKDSTPKYAGNGLLVIMQK